MSLKQRVPLGTVKGTDVFITLEWLKQLNATIAAVASATPAAPAVSTGPSAADFAALVARVKKLEGGYQA